MTKGTSTTTTVVEAELRVPLGTGTGLAGGVAEEWRHEIYLHLFSWPLVKAFWA